MRTLLLSLAFAASAAAAEPVEVQSLRRQAADLGAAGDYAAASAVYRRAAELRPKDPAVLKDLMWALWKTPERQQEAAGPALAVLAMLPSDLEALNMLAQVRFAAGDKDEALRLYKRSLAVDGSQASVKRALARVYELMKEHETALKLLEEARRSQEGDPMLHAQIGRVRFHQGDYRGSAAAWRTASELWAENADYRLQLAIALYFAGDKDGSKGLLESVLAADPRNWAALDFFIDVSSMTRDFEPALRASQAALQDCPPPQEGRLLRLAELYLALGQERRFREAAERLKGLDPANADVLLSEGYFLLDRGDAEGAAEDFRKAAALNPDSEKAWTGLALALEERGRRGEAAAAMEKALALDPSDPYRLLAYSRALYNAGKKREATGLLSSWLSKDSGESLPVLLYHGIAPSDDDPMLANPIHVSSAVFAAQLRALKKAGFVPISAAEAAAWFSGKGAPPASKPILVTFDDARSDSLRNADPVLRELGFKAVMFAPMSNVEGDLPGFAAWKELAAYAKTGRWEVQAHGDLGHTYVAADASGRRKLFLPNRRWLDAQARLETPAEWAARVHADYEGSVAKLKRALGVDSPLFAYPEGDYGQLGAPNLAGSSRLSRAICREHHSVCFQQDPRGVNPRSRDPGMAVRVEPRQEWSGERLARMFTDRSPAVLVRRELILRALWDDDPAAAKALLEANRAAGVSEPTLLSDEARLLAATGDLAGALRLAKRAYELDPSEENRRLVESLSREEKVLAWTAEASYYEDSQGREHHLARQSLGPLRLGKAALAPLHHYGSYRETGLPTVSDHGGGLALTLPLGLRHELALSGEGHVYSSTPTELASEGRLSSRWSKAFSSLLFGGRRRFPTVRAVLAGARDGYAGAELRAEDAGGWQAVLRGRCSDLTDSNQRATGLLRAGGPPLARFKPLRLTYQLLVDATKRISPNYYSPQSLVMNLAGPELALELARGLRLNGSYLSGYGEERGSSDHFIQAADAELAWTLGRLTLKPSVSLIRTPTYKGDTYTLGADWKF